MPTDLMYTFDDLFKHIFCSIFQIVNVYLNDTHEWYYLALGSSTQCDYIV